MGWKGEPAEGKALNQYIESSEKVSSILDQIARIASTNVYVYDSRRKSCYIRRKDSRKLERKNGMPETNWPEADQQRHVRFFIGASGVMMAAVRIYIGGGYEGNLAAAPFTAEMADLHAFMEETQDSFITYLPELEERIEAARDHVPAALSFTELQSLICLLKSGKRCLENLIFDEILREETRKTKNRCSVIGLRYQNLLTLSKRVYKAIQDTAQSFDRFSIFLLKDETGSCLPEPTGTARLERAVEWIHKTCIRWQGKMWSIREEIKLIEEWMILEKQMMNGLFDVNLSVQETCESCLIPFGTLQTLMECSADNAVMNGNYRKKVSISVRREREFCKILFADSLAVIPEPRLEKLRRLCWDMDSLTEIEGWYREGMPELERMILNMQGLLRKDFALDIDSNEVSGIQIQMKYKYRT